MWTYNYSNELYHYGVLGMKWGVRKGRSTSSKSTRKRKASNYHEDYKKAHSGKSVKYMSDKELNDTNRRLQAERQYDQLTKKTNIGKQIVNTFIATAGTMVAIEGAYKTYKRFGDMAINKIGKTKI